MKQISRNVDKNLLKIVQHLLAGTASPFLISHDIWNRGPEASRRDRLPEGRDGEDAGGPEGVDSGAIAINSCTPLLTASTRFNLGMTSIFFEHACSKRVFEHACSPAKYAYTGNKCIQCLFVPSWFVLEDCRLLISSFEVEWLPVRSSKIVSLVYRNQGKILNLPSRQPLREVEGPRLQEVPKEEEAPYKEAVRPRFPFDRTRLF